MKQRNKKYVISQDSLERARRSGNLFDLIHSQQKNEQFCSSSFMSSADSRQGGSSRKNEQENIGGTSDITSFSSPADNNNQQDRRKLRSPVFKPVDSQGYQGNSFTAPDFYEIEIPDEIFKQIHPHLYSVARRKLWQGYGNWKSKIFK